jgi:ATP-dependent DNA helicase RecQ
LGHDHLSCHGTGRETSANDWHFLCDELLRESLLTLDSEYNVLKITRRGMEVLRDDVRVTLPERRQFKKPEEELPDQPHADLFEQLRTLRKRLADDQDVPPYVIFHDRTLRRMAARLPKNRYELGRIPGIGNRKLDAYGDVLIAAMREYVDRTGAEPEALAEPPPKPLPKSSGTTSETLRLFKDGLSIADIAEVRGMTAQTIELHLANAIESGADVDIDALVPTLKQQAIRRAFETSEDQFLRPVLESLGPGYSYAEVRLVRAAMSRQRVEASA